MKEKKTIIKEVEQLDLSDSNKELDSRKKDNDLNTISQDEIQKAFDFQKEKVGWDFYSEREFIENLFSQRFNYLIVMYSLFLTAAASVSSQKNLIIVLSLGVIMTILVSFTIYRAYVKLIINLKILHRLENHIFQLIDKEARSMGRKGFIGVNQIIGKYIPLFCVGTLILGLICAIFGWI